MSKKLRELLTKRDTLDTEIGELSNRGAEIATADEAADEMRTELSELAESSRSSARTARLE